LQEQETFPKILCIGMQIVSHTNPVVCFFFY